MNLPGLRKLLTYAMNLLGFATLHLSGEMSPIVLALFYVGVVASWWWEPPRVDLRRFGGIWTAITLAMFAWVVIDIAVLDEFFLIAALQFVVFMAGAKLFQRAEHKDYTQSMALSLLLLAAGSALNDNMSFGLIFAAYVFAAVLALTAQHLDHETTLHGRRSDSLRVERVVWYTTLGLAALVFAGSVAFFFSFPRVGFGFFMSQSRRGVTTSGFSDRVELGNHGTIREDASIVLRAEFPEGIPDEPGNLRWRGLSLNHWDGRTWSDRDDRAVSMSRFADGYTMPWHPDVDTWLERRPTGGVGGDVAWEDAIRGARPVRIYREPIGSDVLFSLGRIRAIGLQRIGSDVSDAVLGRSVRADLSGEVQLRSRDDIGIAYTDWSVPVAADPATLRDATWWGGAIDLPSSIETLASLVPEGVEVVEQPERRRGRERRSETLMRAQMMLGRDAAFELETLARYYLQLPEGSITPRMRALSTELRAGAKSPWQYASAVEDRLKTTLAYTTTLPKPQTEDENLVDSFLFDWRRGHCEYFATAMVVLLRQEGIPARIVNGFLGAQKNEFAAYWVVRQANAHSWVEAYMPQHGWVTFDPTPSAGGFQPTEADVWQRMDEAIDNLRLAWFRWVVEYNLEKQAGLVRDIFRNTVGSQRESLDPETADRLRKAGWLLWRNLRAILLNLGIAVVFAVLYRRRAAAREPWAIRDNLIAAAWVVTVALVTLRFASRGFTANAVAIALIVPVVGTIIAWLARRSLFDTGDGGPKRARASMQISVLYTRLIREIERERGEVPLALTSGEIVAWADLPDPATRAEVERFLRYYDEVRFGGREVSAEEMAHRRRVVDGLVKKIRAAWRAARRRGAAT